VYPIRLRTANSAAPLTASIRSLSSIRSSKEGAEPGCRARTVPRGQRQLDAKPGRGGGGQGGTAVGGLCAVGKATPKPVVLGPFRVSASPTELRVVGQARSMGTPDAEAAIAPARPQAVSAPGMPEPGFIAPDFHCENMRGVAVDWLEWQAPDCLSSAALCAAAGAGPAGTRSRLAEGRQDQTARRRHHASSGEAIAAGLFVTVGLWFGAGAAKTLRKTAVVGHEISAAVGGARTVGGARAGVNAAPATGVARRSLSWVRSAISKRATVELTDTFHTGMESWNAAARSWPRAGPAIPTGMCGRANWLSTARQRPLGLPAGFFGQIESKSMGWVVRARDLQNYYAMSSWWWNPGCAPSSP